ncbi:hypothetical protein CPB85DRAFT_1441952 [Mucidula mucida]|nr:hypothetical protein CPB85DRAFT_1441952 [Mucidula mucida]
MGKDLVKGMMAMKLHDSTETNSVSIAGERRGRHHQNVIAAAPYQSAYQPVNANPYQDTNWNAYQNPNGNAYQNTNPYPDPNTYADPYQNTPPVSPYNPSRSLTPIIPDIVTPGAAATLNHTGGWSQQRTSDSDGTPTPTRVRNLPFPSTRTRNWNYK